MGWLKTLPAADQKLSTLAATITDGWKAIEEADETSGTKISQRAILLSDRTVSASANDPTVAGATTYLYSKQDAGAVQESYIRDAASNIIQLTNAGALGGATTDLQLSNFAFTANMLPTAMAVVPAAGTSYTREINFATVTRPSPGKFVLVSDAVFANANVYISAIVDNTASTVQVEAAVTYLAGVITVSLAVKDASGNASNTGFQVVIFGGAV